MEINCTEWQEICRICLQEGELFSVFDFDNENSELNIADKVMQCSSIEVGFFTSNFLISFSFHL